MSHPELGDLDTLVRRALAEDLHAGDITSLAVVPEGMQARGRVLAKQGLVFCGGPIAVEVMRIVDTRTHVAVLVPERTLVDSGAILAELDGSARALLAAERTMLNLLQRVCGIATLTRRYVDAAQGRCRIVDTRKTTPGLRALERYAVRCGGGFNHRNDLGSGVLIKDNHIRCVGNLAQAVRRARERSSHAHVVQCEVNDITELEQALAAGADAVLLDNMDDEAIATAVAIVAGRVIVEVSGGVTLERIARLAGMGVDVVSVGALTHSAPAVDLSLELDT